MKNIAITGMGLITSLGNGLEANEAALRTGKSGIQRVPNWEEYGLDCQVGGICDEDPECPLLDAKRKRFMTTNSRIAVAAAYEALVQAKLEPKDLQNKRIAIILGCAGSAYEEIYLRARAFMDSGGKVRKVSPFIVPRVMPSSAVANLSLILGITGETFDISSACASSAHAMITAARLLDAGVYDIIISGGTEELNWVHALGFNAMRAVSRKYNETPEKASRPFDRDRDGFVLAEGAGIVVMETVRHAQTRGVKPQALVNGIAANSNAFDMVVPSAQYSSEVMKMALDDAGLKPKDISYINTHGTGTPTGDPVEMESIKLLFGEHASKIPVNSTKSMTGHMIGATCSIEAIFCIQMMNGKFLSPSINLENPEEEFAWADFVRDTREGVEINHCLTNSFGFGGTNASLVLSKAE